MIDLLAIAQHGLTVLIDGTVALLPPAAVFIALAFVLKRREAWAAFRRAAGELRINLALYFIDALLVLPLLALVTGVVDLIMRQSGLILVPPGFWLGAGELPTLIAAVFLGDFIGYWRHRLEHTKWLWPTHAIHHSDTEMTWLTLDRFHPINRLTTTVIDSAFLLACGLPAWAVVANTLLRHYYGYFIHADLPWTYGPLGRVFVSPAMHRWHHAREYRYAGTNFATVFSILDVAFGTFALPGPCDVPLGLEQPIGNGVAGQLAYPFKRWFADAIKALRAQRPRRGQPRSIATPPDPPR